MMRFEIDEKNLVTRCVSGGVVYGEQLFKGRLVTVQHSVMGRPNYQGDTDPMGIDWIKDAVGSLPVEAFELEVDGQSLHSHWQWEGAEEKREADAVLGIVTLRHEVRPVRIRVHTRMNGTPFLQRWLTIENTGDVPMAISRVSPMAGMLWQVNDLYEHKRAPQYQVCVLPDVMWGYEGYMQWRDLEPGTMSLSSHMGRSGWGMPWFMARNCASGEAFIAHLEFSMNWRWSLTQHSAPGQNKSLLTFSMGPEARAPLWVAAPGELITTPVIHLGHMQGGTVPCVQATHRHLRAISRPVNENNLLIGGARIVDGDLDWLYNEAKLAADMGMEYFLVDAGWYCDNTNVWFPSTGDWEVKRFGGTLDAVRETIHGLGMKFGLWLEPESAGKLSNLYKEKQDWHLQIDGTRERSGGRVLDLSKPEVYAYARENVMRLFEEFKVDLYKIDYNSSSYEGGENLKDGYYENACCRYVEALYRIYDEIAEKHPDVLLENCAGGGGRNDVGMMRRTHVSALSDYSVLPRSIMALNNVTMALPPERIRFYYGHLPSYHHYGGLETHLRLLMFCNPLFVGFGRDESWYNPDTAAVIKKYVKLYKDYAKKVLPTCVMVHHTPALDFKGDDQWCVMECALPDRSMGYAGVFRLIEGDGVYELRLRGVDYAANYQITLLGSGQSYVTSGAVLAEQGLRIKLEGALTSEMVLYSLTN